MRFPQQLTALALALPLAILPIACGDDDQRAALQTEELDRELELALQGDSAGVFEDTSAGLVPAEAVPPQPAPSYRPSSGSRSPAPAPVRRTTDRTPAPATRAPRTVTSSAAAGTMFAITLNETLSTGKNQVGDGFTATLQDPIMDTDGNVLIPAGATVRGRVTRVQKSGNVTQTGVIGLAFESISYGGRSYPLDATVIEAHPDRVTRQSTAQQAGKVAAGAAAGAIIGRVLGKDTKSTLKGAVIGAAAGTAVAMGTSDVDAVLKAGSTVRVRLDESITVRRTIS
ncbi:MAG: glycine zipper 2TM domain-containing protein [Gemmatimonadota bacterium]